MTNPEATSTIAQTLDHVAEGLRMGSLELGNVEMSQTSMPTPGADGRIEYKPTGEFTLVVTYKRKDA